MGQGRHTPRSISDPVYPRERGGEGEDIIIIIIIALRFFTLGKYIST